MPRMAAFLRGINVGGHRVSRHELVAILAGIGVEDATTYRASGNLIFATDGGEEAVVAAIESALADGLGYEVPALVRSAEQLGEIAAAEPFAAAGDGRGKHQVIFLRAAPRAAERRSAASLVGPDEILEFVGRELHWSPSAGVLDSEIDLDAIERLLGPTTMRTMGTVRGVAAKLG